LIIYEADHSKILENWDWVKMGIIRQGFRHSIGGFISGRKFIRRILKEVNLVIFASVFAIVIGLAMLGLWVMLYLRKQIPELKTEPYRIGFHLAGEALTAAMLVIGGTGVLLGTSWGLWIYLIAMGMLFYTAIVSPGYYAQKGEWSMVIIFTIVTVLGLLSLFFVFNKS